MAKRVEEECRFMKLGQAVRETGISRETFLAKAGRGELRLFRLGPKLHLLLRAEAAQMLEQSEVRPTAKAAAASA